MLKQGLVCSFLLLLLAQAKYYTIDRDFHVKEIPESIADFAMHDPKMVGFIEYRDDRENSGWIYYYYKASSANADWLQLYLSGYMEGYAGYNFIWDNYVNSEMYFTINDEIMGFVHNQTNWIHQQIAENPQDNYWNLVNATFAQIYGMYDGYQAGIKASHHIEMNLTFDQFYMVTYLMDLFDVISKYTGNTVSRPPKCSFLSRMTEESLYVSHTTWFDYTGLLRIYKVLDFDLQNPLVQTKRISFSSQPGYATSQDDFYILDNGRMVAETSLQSNNNDVYSWIHYDSVPYWIRITVANLAYDNQQNWTNIYFAYRSGTYNNQWLVIDFNNFNASKGNPSEAKDIIWIVEEFYSLTSAQDVTQQLLIPQGYVGSYNVPYVPEIQVLSQNPTNYTTDPRYFLFKKYAPGIETMEDFKYVMRLDNVSDTQDYCQAIAPRCDLSGSTDFPWGAIDCKTTDETMAPNHQAWIQSGPTHENLPPFTWANWPQYNNSRLGMPEVYDFDWVYMDPNQNYSAKHDEYGVLAFEGYYAFIMEGNLEKKSHSI